MSKRAEIDATEAYAFLGVVAPKLEQLRRRLVVANEHLKSGDPETARLNAIIESQLAIKEFMTALTDLRDLIEPVDIVLEAVREEQAAPVAAAEVPVPEPSPPEPPPAEPAPPEPVAPVVEVAKKPARPSLDQASGEAWLQIGTALAIERLVAAGMTVPNAEFHLEDVYATVGLTQEDGSPITETTIKEWRSKFGARKSSWRTGAIKRRVTASKSGNPISDAKLRVNDMAGTFLRMAQLGASKGR